MSVYVIIYSIFVGYYLWFAAKLFRGQKSFTKRITWKSKLIGGGIYLFFAMIWFSMAMLASQGLL